MERRLRPNGWEFLRRRRASIGSALRHGAVRGRAKAILRTLTSSRSERRAYRIPSSTASGRSGIQSAFAHARFDRERLAEAWHLQDRPARVPKVRVDSVPLHALRR